ncbi:InlB B-repeat-containing protein [Arthrobacter sp. GMC3]|uniref:InlB B-repeat-containing protein n=1 Tax=Arthrobacter sp. GMC3 TaxID=2058894 RepID=UPI0011B06EA0|nr:InlB B-repeat-containing protein [Arthrobacter sp. GMC3]
MPTASSAVPSRARHATFCRVLAGAVATAALLTASFALVPVAPASAAVGVANPAALAMAFANGGLVTLGGNFSVSSSDAPIAVRVGNPVTLNLNGYKLTTTGAGNRAGIEVPKGASFTLTADGGGILTAIAGNFAAGIGGSADGAGGTIEIAGGTVTATGSGFGAGIGGGSHSDSGSIKISGGTVTATAGIGAAGIGGGNVGDGGTIKITGGSVTSTGGENAAGIGGGDTGDGGNIEITGGTVTTTGGKYGAGIGGGVGRHGGVLNVSNGVVTATGGRDGGAGIGGGAGFDGGMYGGNGGEIKITGGKVAVAGSANSPTVVIGAGAYGTEFGSLANSGTLTIAAGSTLRIPAGTTVANSGTIRNHGTINVGGAITNLGRIVSPGTITPVEKVAGNNYLVSFDDTKSTPPTNSQKRIFAGSLEAAEASLPTLVPPSHYSAGWFTAASGGAKWGIASAINSDLTLHSQWILDTHTVSFDSAGGSAVAPVSTNFGTAIAAPAVSTFAGHTFVGWFNGGSAWNFATPVAGDMQLVAQWTLDTHTVTFDSAGGSAVDPVSTKYGTAIAATAVPAFAGHTFVGWFNGGSAWNFAAPVTGDLTFEARWTLDSHTVSFDTGGGSAVAPMTANYGTAISAPGVPTLAGHTFVGWFNGGSAWNFAAPVMGDMTLDAQWTLDTHKVTFDTHGGNTVAPVTADYGTVVEAPPVPTFAGHTFAGWFNGGSAWDFATPVTGDMTLDALWTLDTHLVTFDANGGNAIAEVTTDFGTAVAAPAVPTFAGHTFVGWFNGGKAWDFTMAVTGDMTLVAQWTLDTLKVTFDTHGGNTIASVPTDYGTVVPAPAVPTFAGHTFVAWFNGGTPWDFATPVTVDITLDAHWTLDTHKVIFDTHGGNAIAEVTRDYGTAVAAPDAPTKTGHTFVGWFNGGKAWDFTTAVTEDTTLVAQWNLDTHKVTFDTHGGNAVTPVTADFGTVIQAPAAPTRAGYTFTGWFQDVELTAVFDFNSTITADTALNAGWTKNVVAPPVDNAVIPPTTSPAADNPAAKPPATPGTGLATTGAAGLTGGLFAALALLLGGAVLVLIRKRAKRS